MSFLSALDRVIPEPVIDEIPFSIALPIVLSPTSTRKLSVIFLEPTFFDSFLNTFVMN